MRVIYFGIFDPEFSRNKVFRDALLARGIDVEIMSERGKGVGKYLRLVKRLRSASNYDAVIVGYPGYTCAPLAKLFSRKPVIFDALCTYWEGQVLSRDAYHGNPLGLLWCRFIDWLSVKSADKVLVETRAQKKFFLTRFGVSESKVSVVYTGVDESIFAQRVSHSRGDRFEVLFRGRITDEAGVEYIIRAAKILEESGVFFKIIGFGWALPMARAESVLKELSPKNLEWIKKKLPFDELLKEMSTASTSLGQFGNNDRLKRTIPHKAFEAMLLGLPYITAEAEGIREAVEDGVTGFFVKPADAQAIADKIVFVRDHNTEAAKVATNARLLYEKHFSKAALGATLVDVLQSNG